MYASVFINQPCALFIDKCVYISDVVVVKSLYITFLIHKKQFAFQVNALRVIIKLSFWVTWADSWVALL